MSAKIKLATRFIKSVIISAPLICNASQSGIPAYSLNATGSSSCHNCHSFSDSAPSNSLAITGINSVLAGSTNSYSIKLIAPYTQPVSFGGFDLSTSAGTLLSTDAETSIINSELVHSDRKATIDTGSSYDVQWAFDWQAPAVAGTTTLSACGLPVNGDGEEVPSDHHGSDDGLVACTTFNIQVLQKPTAIAGNNQTLTENNNVLLDGSLSSDTDGSISSYLWEQTAGTIATLNDASSANADFIAPNVSSNTTDELIFRLTVTDNDGLTDTDTLSIFVQDALVTNQPPIASAGNNQSVNETTIVNLDASASTDDGTISSYLWEQTGGTYTVALSNTGIVNPTFTAPAVDSSGDVLNFQLTVTDDLGVSATDTVMITINDVDTPPTAKITDASGVVITAINNNAPVTLYGNFSNDPEGPITAYSWSQTAGTTIINAGPTNSNSFSFTAPDDLGNSIDIQLTVTGDEGFVQDTINATLLLNNLPPVVDAGLEQIVTEGETITLHGFVTDPNNNLSSVQWQQINCNSSCIMPLVNVALPLTNDDAHATILSPPVSGNSQTLVFELTASDTGGLLSTSTTQVIVNDNGIGNFPADAIPFTSFNGRPMAISVQSLDPAVTAVITQLQPDDNASISDNTNRPASFPYELTNLEITLSAPGSVRVTLYFPEALNADYDFYQYLNNYNWVNTSKAKNFDDLNFDASNGWQEITEQAELSADRRSVSFLLTDGGPSDENPATLVISTRTAMAQNPPVTIKQPGATGTVSPLSPWLFSFSLYLLRLFRGTDLN